MFYLIYSTHCAYSVFVSLWVILYRTACVDTLDSDFLLLLSRYPTYNSLGCYSRIPSARYDDDRLGSDSAGCWRVTHSISNLRPVRPRVPWVPIVWRPAPPRTMSPLSKTPPPYSCPGQRSFSYVGPQTRTSTLSLEGAHAAPLRKRNL